MTNATPEGNERQRFEEWAREFRFDLMRSDSSYVNEPYANKMTDWSWLAWQAAIDAAPSPPASPDLSVMREAVEALKRIDKATFSHVDGRDLFAQMHPRNTLDIKRRRDGVETWFEGDWLTDLWREIKAARPVLAKLEEVMKEKPHDQQG